MSPQFKFKIAVEALKGIHSINEIAAEHQVHPAQVTTKSEPRSWSGPSDERSSRRSFS